MRTWSLLQPCHGLAWYCSTTRNRPTSPITVTYQAYTRVGDMISSRFVTVLQHISKLIFYFKTNTVTCQNQSVMKMYSPISYFCSLSLFYEERESAVHFHDILRLIAKTMLQHRADGIFCLPTRWRHCSIIVVAEFCCFVV